VQQLGSPIIFSIGKHYFKLFLKLPWWICGEKLHYPWYCTTKIHQIRKSKQAKVAKRAL